MCNSGWGSAGGMAVLAGPLSSIYHAKGASFWPERCSHLAETLSDDVPYGQITPVIAIATSLTTHAPLAKGVQALIRGMDCPEPLVLYQYIADHPHPQ